MKNLLMLSLAFALFLSAQRSVLGQTIVYDASRDYSTQYNPNGVWSYGWKASANGPFSLLTYNQMSSFGDGTPVQFWSLALGVAPATGYNSSTNTAVQDGGQGVFPPGTLWLGGGVDGRPENFCVVRFTVPSQGSGEYLLQSTVRPYLDGDLSGDVDYHVDVNGSEVFGVFLPPRTGTNYSNTFRLSVGDTVDFMVGRGADGHNYGSALKLQATLSPTICTPHKAKATAQLVNGFVVRATITDSGCGYTNAPLVLIQDGGGSGATARAVITDGRVTGIIITDAGIGYETPPRIVIASPPFVPTVSISVSKVKVVQNVVLGRNYVLEASHDAASWSQALPPFSATSESITNEFDTDLTGRYFRVRETP